MHKHFKYSCKYWTFVDIWSKSNDKDDEKKKSAVCSRVILLLFETSQFHFSTRETFFNHRGSTKHMIFFI